MEVSSFKLKAARFPKNVAVRHIAVMRVHAKKYKIFPHCCLIFGYAGLY